MSLYRRSVVTLLQADGNFDLENNANRGDGNDVFRAGFKTALHSTTNPTTNGYQNGNVVMPVTRSAKSRRAARR